MAAKGDRTRERVLDATIALIAEVGYAHTTIRAIAAAADVAEGTIYRHFPDKPSILVAALLKRHAPIDEWMAQLPELAGRRTVADNLTECLLRLAELRASVLPLELAILTDPDLQRARREIVASGRAPGPPARLAAYLKAEQERGRIRGDQDPGELALLLLAMLFGLAMADPAASGRRRARTVRTAVTAVLEGIAGERDAPGERPE